MIVSAVGEARWLTPSRAQALCRILACAVLLVAGLFVAFYVTSTRAAPGQRPIALDFDAFWAASRLALLGHPAAAYDNAAIEAVERGATTMPPGYLAFYYPPTFLLLCLPLGLLGYTASLLAFVGLQYCLLTACLRRMLPGREWRLAIAIWPGFVMNALSGQNGGLSASCFAGYALLLDRRPALAGMCLGALACKPQLAPCVAVAVLVSRRWRAAAGCVGMATALVVLSLLAFGSEAWLGFLANLANARRDLETLAIKWPKMQSAYAAIRLAGGGARAAYAAQGVSAVAALTILAWAAWRRPGAGAEASVLALSCLLFTPFLYDYDLAILAVPLAWLVAEAQATGWSAWEKAVTGVSFLLPFMLRAAGLGLGVTLGPVMILALLALVLVRLRDRPVLAWHRP